MKIKKSGTESGRFSCNQPNLSSLPRDKVKSTPITRTFIITAEYPSADGECRVENKRVRKPKKTKEKRK